MNTKFSRHSIGREVAIALYEKQWWKFKTPREIAKFQLFVEEIAMPFEVFQKALEEAIGHPVFTHSIVLLYDVIAAELLGSEPMPTLDEIKAIIDGTTASATVLTE